MDSSFSHFRIPAPAIPRDDPPIDAALPRCTLRGSLDPSTGIFYRAPEQSTRMRTAQACDKCRVRKAKCSGNHPVCERCRIRGLVCNYAPEKRTHRWSKTKAQVMDRGTNDRPLVPPLPDVQPRPKSGPSTTSFPLLADEADWPRLGQCARDPFPLHSDRSLSLPDIWHAPDHSLTFGSGSLMPKTQDAKCSLDGDFTPPVDVDALALCFDPYAAGAPFILDSVPAPRPLEETGISPTTGHPVMTGSDCPDDLDCAHYTALFHPSPHSHHSGPGPGPYFDVPVNLGNLPNGRKPSLSCMSDVDSPGRTPSTSSSASPVLTRASSDGLPPTPTNSYPNSPFALATFVNDPHAYPRGDGRQRLGGMPNAYDNACNTRHDKSRPRGLGFGLGMDNVSMNMDAVL